MNSNPIQRFLDPEKILFRAGLSVGQTVADLGAGSGFYALAAARAVGNSGKVYVVDIMESALAHISAEARMMTLKNIQTIRADLDKTNAALEIPDGSSDVVIFANVFHQIKDKKGLLGSAYRMLKTKGKLVVVDWNDKPSPIGPSANERISESEVKKIITAAGMKFNLEIETDHYHYGLIFIK